MENTDKKLFRFFGQKGRWERAVVDSRQVSPGALFFALSGERVDGHDFLKEVREKGGRAAVVSKDYRGSSHHLELIPVPDVKKALQDLAKKLHQKKKQTVIGVTGTVGKTTTKEFIATLLQERMVVTKTPGNANSQIGLPLALINDQSNAEVAVLEMGMSYSKEMARLVEIARPTIGVLTKISLVHAEHFNSIEEIAREKCALFDHVDMERGFFSHSTYAFSEVKKLACVKVPYSYSGKGDYFFEPMGDRFSVNERGIKSPPLSLPFREKHLLENVVAAISLARFFGLSWEEIARGVKKLKPYRHRFEKIERKGILYIDDSYNASPSGVKAALDNLPTPSPGGRTLAALGEMKELGAFSLESHRVVGEKAAMCIDYLLCLGIECLPLVEAFRKSGKPAYLFEELSKLRAHLESVAQAGDVVLVKGSSSLAMWRLCTN